MKKVTFMGGKQDNIGETHIAERFSGLKIKIPNRYNDGIAVVGSNMIYCETNVKKQIRSVINGLGGMIDSQNK